MKRPPYPMPEYIARAVVGAGLQSAYDARPWYQRNDYLRWIDTAKREETRQKRLHQMLDELRAGNAYMKMTWRAGH